MKHSITQFAIALALLLTNLAGQGLAQSTPQKVAGSDWEAATTKTPAVASDGMNRYIVWTGLSNHEIYYAMFNGAEWTDHQVVQGPGWTALTSASPAMIYLGVPYVFWRGESPNEQIYFSGLSGGEWTHPQKVEGTTADGESWMAETKAAPAVSYDGFNFYVAWLGNGTSPHIWYTRTYDESEPLFMFQPQQEVVGSDPSWAAETNVAPSLMSAWNAGAQLFWKGSSAGHIWTSSVARDFTDWTPQATISCPGETSAQPAVAVISNPDYGFDPDPTEMIFWKDSSGWGISYEKLNPAGGYSCGYPHGNDWNAETLIAPAVASYPDVSGGPNAAILVWLDANTNTILYIDPTTLP
jgi:hypothetical protein